MSMLFLFASKIMLSNFPASILLTFHVPIRSFCFSLLYRFFLIPAQSGVKPSSARLIHPPASGSSPIALGDSCSLGDSLLSPISVLVFLSIICSSFHGRMLLAVVCHCFLQEQCPYWTVVLAILPISVVSSA